MEFRAGKMVMDGARVNPDTRKGLIRIGRVREETAYSSYSS